MSNYYAQFITTVSRPLFRRNLQKKGDKLNMLEGGNSTKPTKFANIEPTCRLP